MLASPKCTITLDAWKKCCKVCHEYWLTCWLAEHCEKEARKTLEDKLKAFEGMFNSIDFLIVVSSAIQVGLGIVEELAHLHEAREQYHERIGPRSLSNFLLPLHWIVTEKAEAAWLQLSETDTTTILDHFGWCKGFCDAFYTGPHALAEWFHRQGIGRHIPLAAEPSLEERITFFANMLEYLNAAFESERMRRAEPHSTGTPGAALPAEQYEAVYDATGAAAHGISQVLIHPHGDPSQQECVALVAKVPTHGLDDSMDKNIRTAGKEADKAQDPSATKRTMGVSIRGILPRLREVVLTEAPVPIEYEEFIFTLPGVHFLLRCCMSTHDAQKSGVQLAGVRGAGKSTTLRALVGMLCVGADVDSWHEADASTIFRTGHLAPILRSSTGRVMDHIDPKACVESEEVVEEWIIGGSSDCPWKAPYRHCFDPGAQYAVGSKKLIVFDEVNKALRSRETKHLEFLQHDRSLPPHFLKIFAASPDGLREKVPSGRNVQFFELRPPPVHHVAAIVAVAPYTLEKSVPSGTRLAYADALCTCMRFAANMRPISFVLRRTFRTLQANDAKGPPLADEVHSALAQTTAEFAEEYINLLVGLVTEPVDMTPSIYLEDPLAKQFGATPATSALGFQLTRMSNASMVVRRNATKRNSDVDYVGDIAREVRARAITLLYMQLHKVDHG